ncbi:sigma-70 family RNA polymerase sigma factor [Microbacterium mitrae]|uniref:RNA polymerase subunit sigma-24 n=1 Tax=Microbacterium mitrae TaxID=664640 RepID=A0A5C8HLT3_9MICO|nr:DUF6596 domain-containing protein [Microbacterium mitrae]TXK02703.1 RNA polymerase subunit sigma-24 [Microbacterium mitrae]
MSDIRSTEAALQQHWAPLLRRLTAYSRRFDLAEEALADAFEEAVRLWGATPPDNPAGWLYRTAKNRLVDSLRHEQVLRRRRHLIARPEAIEHEISDAVAPTSPADDRVELLWLACHPALAAEVRPILALRFVLGIDTERIASLFLVNAPTLAARLTRAKKRIAAAGLSTRDATPDPDRAPDVAHALYLAYTAAYYATDQAVASDVVALITTAASAIDDPTLASLRALVTLTHARRTARNPDADTLVTLRDQDRTLWRHDEIAAGLRAYAAIEPTTGFAEELRIMATIAALHCLAPSADRTDWQAIDRAYAKLEALTGSPLSTLNRQAARASSGRSIDPGAVAQLMAEIPHHYRVQVLAAHLQLDGGDIETARATLTAAIAQCPAPHERAALETELRRITQPTVPPAPAG